MIKMVIISAESYYSVGDIINNNTISEIKRVDNDINFYDNAGNLIASLVGGSYTLFY